MDAVQMFCGSIESSVTNTQGKGKNLFDFKGGSRRWLEWTWYNNIYGGEFKIRLKSTVYSSIKRRQ